MGAGRPLAPAVLIGAALALGCGAERPGSGAERPRSGAAERRSDQPTRAERAARPTAPPDAAVDPVAEGRELARTMGCVHCHSLDGKPLVGPSWNGLYGSEHVLTDGRRVTVDGEFVRESILDPMAAVHDGYRPVMPTFRGLLTEAQITALTAYIESLR